MSICQYKSLHVILATYVYLLLIWCFVHVFVLCYCNFWVCLSTFFSQIKWMEYIYSDYLITHVQIIGRQMTKIPYPYQMHLSKDSFHIYPFIPSQLYTDIGKSAIKQHSYRTGPQILEIMLISTLWSKNASK